MNKEQVLWFDGKKNEPELDHWCDVVKRRTCIHNTFKWLESRRFDHFGEKKNWLQTYVEKFGGNDALDHFVKYPPKYSVILY